MNTEKLCTICKEVKPLAAFHVYIRSPDGRKPSCKECRSKAHQLWFLKGGAEKTRLRRLKLGHVINATARALHRKDPRIQMVYGARKRAKQEGLPFILSVDDLVVPTHCPVLGVKMVVGHRDNAPSLDKVVPELGYVKDNVAVMSKRANRIKDNASLAELQQIVSFLKKFFRRQQPSHSATKGVPNGPTNRTRSRRL